jgi:hypothetical protein
LSHKDQRHSEKLGGKTFTNAATALDKIVDHFLAQKLHALQSLEIRTLSPLPAAHFGKLATEVVPIDGQSM